MFHPPGEATTQTPTRPTSATGRPRSVLLVLALLAALGAPLAGAAPAAAQAEAKLELTPARAVTEVNRPIQYTAHLIDANGRHWATTETTLDFGTAPCAETKAAPGEVSCSDNGLFHVTGFERYSEVSSEPVELRVVNVNDREGPAFTSPPASSPPNGEVTVEGSTGSCGQTGTLSSDRLEVDQQVASGFTARFRIPSGTFVGRYPLTLSVRCDAATQTATVDVTVANHPPDAVDDQGTVSPGGSVPIPVTKNDTDPDGDDGYRSELEVDPPTVGTATVQGQEIVYTPGAGFVDGDQFTYRNCEVVDARGKRDCDTATVTITRPDPVPVDDKATTEEETEVPILVTGNDTSPDPAKLRVRTTPKHGTAVVQQNPRDGHISYTPNNGFTGTDRFTYDYCEGIVSANVADPDVCPFATVTVTVTEGKPVPVDDPDVTTVEGRTVDIDVMGNDRNGDADKLEIKPVQPKPKGTPAVLSDGKIQYKPAEGFTGKDSFQYDYCGPPVNLTAREDCPSATVTVDVQPRVPPTVKSIVLNPTPPNRQVVVTGTTGSCPEGTLILFIPPDTDVSAPVRAGPDGGFTASLEVAGGTLVESYLLTLRVDCDDQTQTAEARLQVANRAPDAVDDSARTRQDTSVTIDVTGNDTDPDGDDGYPTALEPGTPAHGTAVEQPGNRIRYTPATGFTGEDRFSYRFCDLVDADGRPDCGAATVVVNVGEPPPEAVDDATRTLRDQPVTIEVTGNDLHPDPAKLHLSRPPAPPATAVEQRQPPGSIRYTPAPGFTGTDTFQYDYCGGSVVVNAAGRAACTPATVTVTVAKPDPAPVDDADVTTVAGQPVVVDVMGNDRDPDPSRLRLRLDPPARSQPEQLSDGRVRYTPEPGQAGTDTFRYDYCRGAGAAAQAACPFATVTVTVTADPVIASVRPGSSPPGRTVEVAGNTGSCARAGTLTLQGTGAAVAVTGDRNGGFTAGLAVPAGTFPGAYRLELLVDCGGQARQAEAILTVTNRAPEAVDDAATTTRDHPATIDVAGNDRDPDDPDGYRNLVLVTSPPAHGTAEVQPDQAILYSPAGGFVGQDRFGYSLCDNVLNAAGAADCGAATVTVTVTDTPVISSVTPGSTPPGQPVQVVGNTGSCSRAGTLIFHGTVDLPLAVSADENGSFATALTVPTGTFPQPYRLELRVDCGGQIQLAEATLTVTNQAPQAVDDPATTTPDTPVTIDVAGNDHDPDDPDGYRNLVLVTTPPTHGTAEEQPDRTIVYTPESGFVGQDRFDYSLCDDVLNAAGAADCGAATVTVTVSATACVPVGTPRLEVAPGKGPGGTRLRITAAVDRRLAACPLRLFLGGTPLDPDVRVGGDGSISADRGVPKDVKPGRSSVRLATLSAQTLADQPFEVAGGPIPWPLRLAVGAGALVVGALARFAFRRWRTSREPRSGRRPTELPDVRAEPHTRPVEVGVEPVPDGTRTFTVRLHPHADPGTQTLHEVTR